MSFWATGLRYLRSPAKLAALAKPYLMRVGLDYVDPLALAEEYSVAERQLIEIARLLSRKCRDRANTGQACTAALSETEIVRVKSAVRAIAAEGCAVIYVTHRMPEVFDLTNRVTVLRNEQELCAPGYPNPFHRCADRGHAP